MDHIEIGDLIFVNSCNCKFPGIFSGIDRKGTIDEIRILFPTLKRNIEKYVFQRFHFFRSIKKLTRTDLINLQDYYFCSWIKKYIQHPETLLTSKNKTLRIWAKKNLLLES